MKIELTVSFNGSWVLGHRDDDKLPVNNLVEVIGKDCRAVKLTRSTFIYAEMALDTDLEAENMPNTVREKLSELYGEKLGAETVAVTYRALSDEEYASLVAQADEEKVELFNDGDEKHLGGESCDEETAASAHHGVDLEREVEKLDEEVRKRLSESFKSKADDEPAVNDAVKNILDEIDRLPGSSEFKSVCHELAVVAPLLKRNNAVDAFSARSYLFVINDGCGLDDDLKLFAKLISATGIKKVSSHPITECKLGPVKDSEEPFESAMRLLGMADMTTSTQLLTIDISEWLIATDSRYFKIFLKALAKQSAYIPIFRIPYVDKYVQDRLERSLGDVLFIKRIVVPPYTHAELEEYARRTFAHYGYTLNKSAWRAFFTRLDDERADGRFYGLDTVRKVVMELLYAKQVYDAKAKKSKSGGKTTEDKLITGRAAAPIIAGIDTTEYGVDALKKLVGSAEIEKRVNEIVAQIELSIKSGKERPCIHMQFVGNPGTGKTTVARIVGKILKERGILSVGNFFEHAGRDFCGRYVGETAPKTSGMCRDAYGSVMFIDEAYSLFRGDGSDRDFGREALDTLIAEMENHRSDFVVIMAGYTDDMKTMMKGNAGLASRVPYTIEFPNFTREQLYEIFVSLASRFDCEPEVLDAAKEYFNGIPDSVLNDKEFSNARFVRNLFERTWAKASMRSQLGGITTVSLVLDDFKRAISDAEFKFDEQNQARIGFRV